MSHSRCRVRWPSALAGAALVASVMAALPTTQGAAFTALRFGKVIDGMGRSIDDAVIVIQADTIVSVGSGWRAVPANARVIDLRRFAAIPGMIDVHTHMTYWRDKAKPTARGPSSKD